MPIRSPWIEPGWLTYGHPLPCTKEALLVLGDPRLVLPFEYSTGHVEGFKALARLPDLFASGDEMLQLFGEQALKAIRFGNKRIGVAFDQGR